MAGNHEAPGSNSIPSPTSGSSSGTSTSAGTSRGSSVAISPSSATSSIIHTSSSTTSSTPILTSSSPTASSNNFFAMVSFKRGDKKNTARAIHYEISRCSDSSSPVESVQLNEILSDLLDPRKAISDSDTISWINHLVAGGRSPDEFAQQVKSYDNAASCGLVWTANFVAYRCRTCGISPCMSLCADCFQKGNHEGHDYNMFRSQAGGACDCGDPSVMKPSGFCAVHAAGACDTKPKPPSDLLSLAQAILPRVLHRLLLQLRDNKPEALKEADGYITNVLTQMTEMGAAMRSVMTSCLIDPKSYSSLTDYRDVELEIYDLLRQKNESYQKAKKELATFKPPENFHQDCSICRSSDNYAIIKAFDKDLIHKSFAEELLFWTIVYEFPQKLVCFLLNMLPDIRYKESFSESFVHHYSRISLMLARFRNGDESPGGSHSSNRPSAHDLLSNCVVHVSVQLFSNEPLADRLCRENHLLHIMIASLRTTIEGVTHGPDDLKGILEKSQLQSASLNKHYVVRCDHYIMRRHSYWPLVSDLNNILTHYPVAQLFMSDSALLESWLEFIMNFQGMNLNTRELDEHVEYENESYYAAFSAELEICATPVWTLISHLKDSSTGHLTKQVISRTQQMLDNWFDLIPFTSFDSPNSYQATFHIPLHRYYAIFLHHATSVQGIPLSDLLPSSEIKLRLYLAHPLQVLISFYEILCGLWVRNGLQMKGQAMTYIQCHFCNSMIDPDIFLIQQCSSRLNPDWFIQAVFERFHVWEWLSFSYTKEKPYRRGFLEPEQMMPMLEGALTFLATLFSTRTNLGFSEEEITRQEMVTLLSMSDRTHSQLLDLLPEKCGTTGQNKDFEAILSDVAEFKGPTLESGGNLSQGMFYPKSYVWENEFDPLHVLLRAVHRRDYQSSMDRFASHVKQSGRCSNLPWPPFRLPPDPDTLKFLDPRKLLYSKVLHGVLFSILYKASYVCDITDQVLALTVFLIEMSLSFPNVNDDTKRSSPVPTITEINSPFCVSDQKYSEWFTSDWILVNFNTTIQTVTSADAYPETGTVALNRSRESMGPSVEEMEVDIQSSSDENGNDEEYMSADEDFVDADDEDEDNPNHPHHHHQQMQMSIEGAPQTRSLPSINLPLALPPPSPSGTPSPSASSALVPIIHGSVATGTTRAHMSTPHPTLGPPALPGPSTSPTTGPAASGSGALAVLRPIRRFRRRQRQLSALTAPSLFDDMARSAPAGYQEPQLAELMRALPSSSSTASLTHSSVSVNESILSLLLRLHSKLSNEPDSYRPGPVDPSRIGDGPHFIRRVLNIYSKMNVTNGDNSIDVWRQRIWPKPKGSSTDSSGVMSDHMKGADGTSIDGKSPAKSEFEEKKRRAKERQQKLMAEFASRQKAFMKKMEMEEVNYMDDDLVDADVPDGEPQIQAIEYECVICNQTTTSTLEKMIGMVALLQSTSVLGHSLPRYKCIKSFCDETLEDLNVIHDNNIPCHEEQLVERRKSKGNLSYYMELKFDDYSKNFNASSWQNSLSIGWMGGVHVQSCGHYLHLDCHKAYITSLRSQQNNRQGLEQGEFACPLCRQMANSVLPVIPAMTGAVVKSRRKSSDAIPICRELLNLLTDSHQDNKSSAADTMKTLGGFMEDLTKATLPQYRSLQSHPDSNSLYLFLCSIIRTNLECEVLLKNSKSQATGAKKPCFGPLFKVLALNAKVFIQKPYNTLWTQLTGIPEPDDGACMSLIQMEKEVPLLLKDPVALMIQLLVDLPLHIDRAYFCHVVQMIYNLIVIQSLSQLSCHIPDQMRSEFKLNYRKDLQLSGPESVMRRVENLMGLVIETLEQSSLYSWISETESEKPSKGWSPLELLSAVRISCLPLLRTSAIFQSHLYGLEYPVTESIKQNSEEEFLCLKSCLRMHPLTEPSSPLLSPSSASSSVEITTSILSSLFWPTENPTVIIKLWCQEFNCLAQKSLLLSQRPSLLRLPPMYDQLFLFYHQKTCNTCNKHPKEPCICLVCGTLVCMRESCCRSNATLEAVSHAEFCGAGTAIYLAVNSSTIIVIRGKRACVWGSVYLDSYGEEDRDLKRGKPLYLSDERYWVLEQQWLTHSFDHTSKRWVWHKDTL